MSELGNALEQAEREAMTGDVIKSAEMVNRSFTIHSAEEITSMVERVGKDGVKREEENKSWKATVTIDDDEKVQCWIGGYIAFRQVRFLIDHEMLPARVKLIRDSSLDGSPYKLLEGEPPTGVAATNGRVSFNDDLKAIGLDAVYEAFKAEGVDQYLSIDDNGEPVLVASVPLPDMMKITRIIRAAQEPFEEVPA